MAQQTALQQLIEWAVSLKNNSQQCTDWICIKEKAEELLQMEKEQIVQAYVEGINLVPCDVNSTDELDAEKYYDKTFGNK